MKLLMVIGLTGLISFAIIPSRPPIKGPSVSPNSNGHLNETVAVIMSGVVILQIIGMSRRRKTRIELQGDQIRFYGAKESAYIEESLRNVENLTIRIKGGAIGIASWRRVDFKSGKSIIFDGQVERAEELEDLIAQRSGKQFLRWLTGEAYQKPSA